MKDKKVLIQGLSKFVDERNVKKVRLLFEEFHPSDLYEEIKDWPIEKAVLLLRLLKEEEASDLFSEFNTDQQEEIINALTSEEIAEIFEEMYTDEAIDILEELPAKITRKIIKAADSETRSKINSILRYRTNQVGYHMVVDYVAVPSDVTLKKAKEIITSLLNVEDLEIVGNVFVYEKESGEYVGFITPADIISGKDTDKVEDIVESVDPIRTSDDMSAASSAFNKYDFPAIPVVNSKNKLVGVIEAEDIIERYRDVGNDLLEQAAVKKIGKPYLETTVWEMFKARIPWIIALLIVGTLTQMIILGFQHIWAGAGVFDSGNLTGAVELTSIATLSIATAMSMSSSINDAAGNAGSQTSSTLVRALALGEIGKGSYSKAMWKEFSVAFWVGLAVMVTAFVRINVVWALFGYFGGYGQAAVTWEVFGYMMLISMVASASFWITIIIGNLVGAGLPIIADKFDIDGAIFSGPVQTTVVDIITILIYFSLTTIVFIWILPAMGVYPL